MARRRKTSDDEMIWRYLDLSKFLSILTTEELWFARADTFEDKWEGFSRAIPYSAKRERDPKDVYRNLILRHEKWRRQLLKKVFVSCWTLAEESIPMWKIYSSYDSGVAIQSTVGRFRENVQLKDFPASRLGRVQYYADLPPADFDYSQKIPFSWPKACELHLRKRSGFEFEREGRAVIVGREGDRGKGVAVPVAVNELIQRVFVSPLASNSFLRTVAAASQKFGLKVQPKRSRLARRRPRWTVPMIGSPVAPSS